MIAILGIVNAAQGSAQAPSVYRQSPSGHQITSAGKEEEGSVKQICVGGVLPASAVSLGCMRINTLSRRGRRPPCCATAMEKGIDFFDHADIYGGGESERDVCQAAVKSAGIPRERMLHPVEMRHRAGKCLRLFQGAYPGIRRGGQPAAAGTPSMSMCCLLHRPDTLMEPEEVAEAFDELHADRQGPVFRRQQPESACRWSCWARSLHQKLLDQPAPVRPGPHGHDRRGACM